MHVTNTLSHLSSVKSFEGSLFIIYELRNRNFKRHCAYGTTIHALNIKLVLIKCSCNTDWSMFNHTHTHIFPSIKCVVAFKIRKVQLILNRLSLQTNYYRQWNMYLLHHWIVNDHFKWYVISWCRIKKGNLSVERRSCEIYKRCYIDAYNYTMDTHHAS